MSHEDVDVRSCVFKQYNLTLTMCLFGQFLVMFTTYLNCMSMVTFEALDW